MIHGAIIDWKVFAYTRIRLLVDNLDDCINIDQFTSHFFLQFLLNLVNIKSFILFFIGVYLQDKTIGCLGGSEGP